MEEMKGVTGLTGRMGGVAFISAFVAAPEGAEIVVGIGYGRNMKDYAVVASVGGTTAGFTVEEARHLAESFESGLEACPDIPFAPAAKQLIEALKKCAYDAEQIKNGVRQ